MTEADVQFKQPVTLETAVAICRLHDVRLTQIVWRRKVGTENQTNGIMVDRGMDEQAIVKRIRESGFDPAKFLVDELYTTGRADDLRALGDEASVRQAYLKP